MDTGIAAHQAQSKSSCANFVALDVLQCKNVEIIYVLTRFPCAFRFMLCWCMVCKKMFFFVILLKVAMSTVNVVILMLLHKLSVFIYIELS